jgi:hypothetical protein
MRYLKILILLTLSCNHIGIPKEEGTIRIWMYIKGSNNLDSLKLGIRKIESHYDTLSLIYFFDQPYTIDIANLSQSPTEIISTSIPFGKYLGLYFTVEDASFSRGDSTFELRLGIIPETGKNGFILPMDIPIFIDEITDVFIGWFPDSSIIESLGVYWFIPEVDVEIEW